MKLLSYTVDEDSQGFVIRTRWTLDTWERWLSVLGIGAFAWIVLSSFKLSSQLVYLATVTAAIVQAFRCMRMSETCTTITKFEARPTGKFPHGYQPYKFVPLASIVYLTYREEEAQGEDNTLPSGLWAELEQGSACLVPQLTQDDTEALISRIEHRFREVIGCGIEPGRTTGDVITLGLHLGT